MTAKHWLIGLAIIMAAISVESISNHEGCLAFCYEARP